MGKHLIFTFDDAGSTMIPSLQAELGVRHSTPLPNLAAIEAQGLLFPRCYGNPICSPTRALTMTGRHAFRTGVGGNIEATGPPAIGESWLPRALPSHEAGVFGKWHLGTADNGLEMSALTAADFDTHVGFFTLAGLFDYWFWVKSTDGVTAVVGSPSNREPNDYVVKHTGDDTITYLDGVSGDWIVWVALASPHTPRHQPNTAAERAAATPTLAPHMSANMEAVTNAFAADATPYTDMLGNVWLEEEQPLALHLAMLEAADYEIGRIMAHAEVSTGGTINADVTVWVTTDNGDDGSLALPPFNPDHGKGVVYEYGTRLPLIVAGSAIGAAQKGKRCRRPVQTVDIYRTICEMEGVDLAATFPGVTFDGVDISGYFTDHNRKAIREYAYSEVFRPNCDGGVADTATGATNDVDNPSLTYWQRAVHDGHFKLITTYENGPASSDPVYELYNVRGGDPEETVNLIQGNRPTRDGVGGVPEVWAALQRLLAYEASLLP